MPGPETVLSRLEDAELEALLDLLAEDLLRLPTRELLDPTRVASHLARALREAANHPEIEQRLRNHLRQMHTRVRGAADRDGHRPLRDYVPDEVSTLIRTGLETPFQPDRDLLLRLMDHPAVHSILQDVLADVLVRFARRIRSLAPDPHRLPGLDAARKAPGLSRLVAIGSGVAAVGSSVAGALGAELERQLEDRAREFAGQTLSVVLHQVVDAACAPERADLMARWRVHALETLLDARSRDLVRLLEPIDPDRVAAALTRALRTAAARPDLEDRIRDLLERGTGILDESPLGDEIRRTGQEARQHLGGGVIRDLLGPARRRLVGSEAFRTWLAHLLREE